MQKQIHPNTIRQVLFLVVLALLAVLISKELYFLLGSFLGAITFYVLLRNIMLKLVLQYKWKKTLAVLFLIFASLLLITLPFAWLLNFGIQKIMPFVHQPEILKDSFTKINNYLLQEFRIDIFKASYIEKANTYLVGAVQNTLGGMFSMLGTIAITYFILYFLLYNTLEIETWLKRKLPFKNKNVQLLINKSRSLVYSNAIGIPIVAIVQGIVGTIGYLIFGAKEFVLLGLLTAIASVVPVVGTMLVYLPLAVYEMAIGHSWQGIAIALWGFIVIGSSDNVVRFMVQKHIANVHPLITIFGVIMGMNIFGFLGIIFGPILISIFVLLVQIYIDEYGIADADEM